MRPPPALAGHRDDQRLEHVVEAGEARVDDAVPLLGGEPGKGVVVVDAGVAHHAVEGALALHRVFQAGAGRLPVGDIEAEDVRFGAQLQDLRAHPLGFGEAAAAVEGDAEAVGGQAERDGAPDASAGARHEGPAWGWRSGRGHGSSKTFRVLRATRRPSQDSRQSKAPRPAGSAKRTRTSTSSRLPAGKAGWSQA